jgi:hypothetical protein
MRLVKRFEDMTEAEWREHDRALHEVTASQSAAGAAAARRERIAAMKIPPRVLARLAKGDLLETDARRLIVGTAVITVLAGNPGTGKTLAACEWLMNRGRGFFVKTASLARIDRAHMPKLLDAEALVLDDLGMEYLDAKGHLLSLLDELIDHRYDARLPIVITSNIDENVFRSRYGVRVVDRIRESGRFVVIGGTSLRAREVRS